MLLLHDHDVHYNLIVPKGHNAIKKQSQPVKHTKEKYIVEEVTLLKVNRPQKTIVETGHEAFPVKENPPPKVSTPRDETVPEVGSHPPTPKVTVNTTPEEDEGWTVIKKGVKFKETDTKTNNFTVPTQNRFKDLDETKTNDNKMHN